MRWHSSSVQNSKIAIQLYYKVVTNCSSLGDCQHWAPLNKIVPALLAIILLLQPSEEQGDEQGEECVCRSWSNKLIVP